MRGSPQNTVRLVDTIKRTLATPGSSDAVQVFAPAEDEVVDTTKERHIYQVSNRKYFRQRHILTCLEVVLYTCYLVIQFSSSIARKGLWLNQGWNDSSSTAYI